MTAKPDATIELPCPNCGEVSAEPLSRILADDVIPCSICGGLIDLMDPQCKDKVQAARNSAAASAAQ